MTASSAILAQCCCLPQTTFLDEYRPCSGFGPNLCMVASIPPIGPVIGIGPPKTPGFSCYEYFQTCQNTPTGSTCGCTFIVDPNEVTFIGNSCDDCEGPPPPSCWRRAIRCACSGSGEDVYLPCQNSYPGNVINVGGLCYTLAETVNQLPPGAIVVTNVSFHATCEQCCGQGGPCECTFCPPRLRMVVAGFHPVINPGFDPCDPCSTATVTLCDNSQTTGAGCCGGSQSGFMSSNPRILTCSDCSLEVITASITCQWPIAIPGMQRYLAIFAARRHPPPPSCHDCGSETGAAHWEAIVPEGICPQSANWTLFFTNFLTGTPSLTVTG